MSPINFITRKHLPIIRQTESAECGLACLAMISNWYGLKTDLSTLRNRFVISTKGITLKHLIEFASVINLTSRAVRLEIEDLKSLKLPCILHWNMNHFVVLNRIHHNKIIIHDPDKGKLTLSFSEIERYFTGVAIELTPTEEFTQLDERKKIHLRQLTGKTPGLFTALIHLFIFALGLEIIALSGPLINQIIIDEVIVSSDENLLTIIIISLLFLAATQLIISLVKEWATIKLSVNFNIQWTTNVFHHLMRLPLTWFDARSQGGINARFNAIDHIQEALTLQVIGCMLDLILIITSLSMMLLYNNLMCFISIIAALIYGTLRFIWHPKIRQSTEEAWDAESNESSYFLETLSGIMSLRINGVIAQRESTWLNLNISRRNTQLKKSKLIMNFRIANTVSNSLVSTIILWKGATEVLDGSFTVGMLVAYLSFQTRFSTSTSNLIDTLFSWRILDVYNERLADIVLTDKEENINKSNSAKSVYVNNNLYMPNKIKHPLIIDNITFSHKGERVEVIKGASLSLNQNEVLAITGKSGCGKSTLVKLILGIVHQNEGVIQTLGVTNDQMNYIDIRKKIGTVLQDDILFKGSIADNIIFYHEEINYERMIQCSQKTLINDDIMAMPMGYQTLIGENGNGLSGGQKQRILLARALYKKPALLILDEATSHLDIESEILISQTLRQEGVPILLIAHRPETIASADRVLLMENGNFIQLNSCT
ncbi:peptidase domain-containing ABC transporter [Escherichia albertii]|uniref:peptidase domain-containing ABC transporter n=1 Tax=Escherichia albertii TaxID=208962 RepID=UPI0021D468AB|nr:peptidase domain-containing ABC transporter [Escherichia albertii]EJM0809798.1 peptidase domain-containing ABC transporter [Escherichia albertii]EJM1766586.1 peptidase domain-containing ABC transporter [Escherichia albertii]EJM2114992.1 peptidase domain-containing ABC transporter [Escherichia albertii]EJO0116855.1 peptidase domain-containing ABC transporter [Escherichia albertii]MCU7314214.1 peptidase domain-containing ABC transporter [Escherichia albertii]